LKLYVPAKIERRVFPDKTPARRMVCVVGDLEAWKTTRSGSGFIMQGRHDQSAGKRENERPCTHMNEGRQKLAHLESSWPLLILTPISERFVGLSFANQQEMGPS
jgi:hypothetical protein